MKDKKSHCVTVMRANPRSIRLFEQGKAKKVIWDILGERCFRSKAAKDRYVKKMTKPRPGRARITAD